MALAWVFERQQPRDAVRASKLLAACGEEPGWVLGLWHLELAHRLGAFLASSPAAPPGRRRAGRRAQRSMSLGQTLATA
jgi:hypothetical protein